MTDRETDQRRGTYVPPIDEDDTFDARDDSRRGPLLLTAAAAVLVLFVGVVWSAYHQGVREGGRDAAPRIVADSEPFRERPADPGGQETRDLDISAYDLLSGETETGDDDATPRPGPEEPVGDGARPGLQVESVDPDGAGSTNSDGPPVRLDPPVETPVETPTETPADRPVETVQAPSPETTPTPAPAQTPTLSVAVAASGDWMVQIGSFRTLDEAESAWVNFISRYSDVASGVSPDIQAAEIEGRGTYHRLRIAAFGSRADASDYCAALQSRGQDCFVASR